MSWAGGPGLFCWCNLFNYKYTDILFLVHINADRVPLWFTERSYPFTIICSAPCMLYRVAQKERNSRYSRFSGLCSNQQLLSLLCWIEHLFPIIITSRSSNLVENFLFYKTFLMDCHFRDLPDFQSFEAR